MTAASSPDLGTDEGTRVRLDAWLVTDVGVVRDHNEDSAAMEPARGFFIVADGMGGHAAGEVASAMAVETVKKTLEGAHDQIDAFKKAPSDTGRRALVQLLQSAVLQAHQAVYQRGQSEQDKAGMGTTLDVVLVAGAEAFVAHVGDSRTYLVRDGRSSQITTDHTVAEVLVIEGKLTIEEAQVSPLRTILVNAIGVSADVGVEMAHVTLKRGDRLLLCSDGLHDYFPVEEEIAQRMSEDKPGDALKDMVELAKTRGGHDNITGVAVHVVEIVDAVPSQMADESTHPVEISPPTFGGDEPTQTNVTPPTGTSGTGERFKSTQPMKAVGEGEDIGSATTLPPPPTKKVGGAKPDDEAKTDPAKAKTDDEPKTVPAKGEAAKPPTEEAKTEPAKGQAKPEDEAKTEPAKADAAKTEETKPAKDDAAPVAELGTADTGRVAQQKKKD